MSTKKVVTSKAITKNGPVAKKLNVTKKPKFKLISYTLKATIPTGQYANIQPEITVQAESIEAAERAVMPYIETLFAKYRNGEVPPFTAAALARPAVSVVPVTLKDPETKNTPVPTPTPVTPAIVMTVPFTRAESAIESCTSIEALELIETQIQKSEKLITDEKQQLSTKILLKRKQLNGK